jgi:alpha-glucosidase (family GH31 glycosyl hydrolase)
VHPFALIQTQKVNRFFGVYFRNTNAMSPVITYTGNTTSTLSFIATGGQIEMYLFWAGNPREIVKRYQSMIGTPALPPFWALGFQVYPTCIQRDQDRECDPSYRGLNKTQLEFIVNNYTANGFPLEAIWLGHYEG